MDTQLKIRLSAFVGILVGTLFVAAVNFYPDAVTKTGRKLSATLATVLVIFTLVIFVRLVRHVLAESTNDIPTKPLAGCLMGILLGGVGTACYYLSGFFIVPAIFLSMLVLALLISILYDIDIVD